MKLWINYDEDDLIAKVFMLYFAFQHGAIGVVLLTQDLSSYNSKTVLGMSEMLPMSSWGLILIFSAANFINATIQVSKLAYLAMVIAGVSGVIVFGLLSMASLELSINQTNTVNYMIISSIDVVLAIIGGVALWLRRTI